MRRLVSPLDGIRSPFGGRFGFSPASLFAAGGLGALYDPSDFSTMWQDAAGTTPATAATDPAGLILDKRLGLQIGAELVTNNTFGADTDWTKGTGWSIGSGVATKTAGTASLLSQAEALTAGVTYRLVYTITRSAGSITPQFTGGSTVSGTARSNSGTYVDILTAVSGNTTLAFSAGAGFAGTVDNVHLKRASGNDAWQLTPGARPLLQQDAGGRWYLAVDGIDDILSSATQTQIVGPWEFWAGVDITTNGGIFTNLFSLSPPTGVSTSAETEGLFQRSDGAIRRAIGASRISAETGYNVDLDDAFTVGSRFVVRVRAKTGPDQVSVTTPAGTATIAAAYTGTPSGGVARYNIGAGAGSAVWRFYGGLAIDRLLTAGEATQLDNWFKGKMGL